eukprot:200537_1
MASPVKSKSPHSNQNDDNPKYPTITRAELAGGYFNKHVAFVIKTPTGAIIKRRYTDFEWLRHLLCSLYPGAFIPPIPPKLPVAMWPQGYLLMRKRELQQFLQRLEVIPYLKAEEVTAFFLKNHGAFDKARKKWEKDHPRPSNRQLFDKMIETFPNIHETKTPEDIDKRCKQSTELINESIAQLDIMVKSSETFIDVTKECCEAMTDFRSCFEELIRIEYSGIEMNNTRYCEDKRVDISPYVEQWKTYKLDEINNMSVYYVPTLNRALNDLRVIKEILLVRDKLQSDYREAKRRADVWNAQDGALVRSSDLAKKHREVQREEDLRYLKGFVEKLVLGQLNVVFCANTRRWKKSVHLFASKHLLALEKVLGSWKNLANKILKDKGHTDGIFKAVPVENMTDDVVKEEVEIKDDVKEEIEIDLEKEEERRKEEEERRRQEEERRQRQKEEEEEAERIRKEREAIEEEERLKKEKKAEELKKQKEASKEKMNQMFTDEQQPQNEFPWDDQ